MRDYGCRIVASQVYSCTNATIWACRVEVPAARPARAPPLWAAEVGPTDDNGYLPMDTNS